MTLTWICHICKKERPDEKIGVLTKTIDGLSKGSTQNILYCKDDKECVQSANKFFHFPEDLKKQLTQQAVMRIVDGWYIFQPNDCCPIGWLCYRQIVQVFEGMVWATRVEEEVSVKTAKEYGVFEKRIKI